MADSEEVRLTLPVLTIKARTLPWGWEQGVLRVWEEGAEIGTDYDKPGDPPSRDATVVIAVADPFAEPRIHRALPGGMYDLEVYTQEVLDGIHDHWIDPAAGKWQYTYHERMENYKVPGLPDPVDQINYILEELVRNPDSRRAQASLWQPWADRLTDHPACLQRVWCRVFGDELVMNVHMRSNDAFKAAFMNMYVFTALQSRIAEGLSGLLGRPIRAGQYNHIADSFHIYGSYFKDFKGFLKSVEDRSWEQRTYRTDDPDIREMFKEAREKIAASLAAGQRASDETF